MIVVLLYLSGRLDRELYKVGLNDHQCGQNGFGAVFCGDDLTAYNDHLQAVQQQATQAEDRPNKISAPQTRPPPAAPEPPRSFRPLLRPSATLGHDLGKHSGHALAGSYKSTTRLEEWYASPFGERAFKARVRSTLAGFAIEPSSPVELARAVSAAHTRARAAGC